VIVEGPRAVVLIVDDQDLFPVRLSRELGGRGHTVLIASSGPAAERLIESLGPPMVVVINLDTRHMSALGFLERLSRRPDARHLRFVLMSALCAHNAYTSSAGQRSAGVQFLKPVNLTKLSAAVRSAAAQLPDLG
jgi:CheY-like chemotaxis protein